MINDFNQLISNQAQARAMLKGSSIPIVSAPDVFADILSWALMRKFVAQTIHHPGTILDVGCGNGFFLRCLQEWQPHVLIPYGFDSVPEYIKQTKDLHPNYSNNFATLFMENIKDFSKTGLPDRYDFVYWAVWDNWDFSSLSNLKLLKTIRSFILPKGRLILSFYSGNKEMNLSKIEQLKSLGYIPQGIINNPSGRSEVVCWFD